jgi:hypothetical protein
VVVGNELQSIGDTLDEVVSGDGRHGVFRGVFFTIAVTALFKPNGCQCHSPSGAACDGSVFKRGIL